MFMRVSAILFINKMLEIRNNITILNANTAQYQ